jgi:hypothetical protein
MRHPVLLETEERGLSVFFCLDDAILPHLLDLPPAAPNPDSACQWLTIARVLWLAFSLAINPRLMDRALANESPHDIQCGFE